VRCVEQESVPEPCAAGRPLYLSAQAALPPREPAHPHPGGQPTQGDCSPHGPGQTSLPVLSNYTSIRFLAFLTFFSMSHSQHSLNEVFCSAATWFQFFILIFYRQHSDNVSSLSEESVESETGSTKVRFV
jgi:hypothetical protein